MSDFDKPTAGTPQPKQGSKVVLMIVLCGVLGGVLVFHFSKGSPQGAAASILPAADGLADATALPTETPEQARAALANDPTAKLLRGNGDTDESFKRVPSNPFLLNDHWRTSLVKTPDPVAAPPAETLNLAATPTPAAPPPQTVKADGFKLSGIFRENQKMVAIINGNLVTVGMVVGNAKVVDIQNGKVTLRHINAPTGPTVDLVLSPKN